MKFFLILLLILGLGNSLKIISSKAAGLKGFYMLGVSKFIKENYDLQNTLFYGASAGSWNSLYLSNNRPNDELFTFIKSLKSKDFENMYQIELAMRNEILKKYTENDFSLHHINICVSVFSDFRFKKQIYSGFESLEDVMNCCMASSHIPYITNKSCYYKYKNIPSIDGGFYNDPHPIQVIPDLIIESNMWGSEFDIHDISNAINIKKLNIQALIEKGYHDASQNIKILDDVLS